ncbi:GNAT family N-acetyltransferase [Allorhizocola rhizosphaerae]|uniref:GNAT family N-acetyltransferase n=1 Tax=Allorhizocola rhizosphaerae TaxID=1872709 RepID=UPI000E3D5B79|nr:GNAT family N-acetyltransferase [Allorhizocola rhizosphaerae]
MQLDFTRVSGDDHAAIDAWCDVMRQVRDHDLPLWRDTTPDMARGFLTVTFPDQDVEGYLAWRAGQPVGRIVFEIPTMENLDNIHLDLWVAPSARRQGIGRRMHEFALRRAAELGRKRMLGWTLWDLPGIPAPNLDGARFAESLGYSTALVDVVRRLDLSAVDDAALDAVAAAARSKADGYRLVSWTDPHPAEHVHDLARLFARLTADAPHGSLQLEEARVDPDRMLAFQAANRARDQIGYHTGAVHEASGRMVAWTAFSKDGTLDWHAFQQITVVDPDHRGRRLGALIKVENLRHLRAAQPGIRAIDTFNADENRYMISINEELGFRPLYAFQNWQREI